MKKPVFFLVVLALLCFAMPAIASPPLALPALEAVGPVASIASGYVVQEVAPYLAVAPGNLPSAQAIYFDSIAPKNLVLLIVIIATAAMLAGLMRATGFAGMRLRSDRGFANGFAGGRRWV